MVERQDDVPGRAVAERERGQDSETQSLAGLVRRIGGDLNVLVRDRLELARAELTGSLRSAVVGAAASLIGALIVLVGLGLVCAAAVVGLAKVIPLWASLLILAGVYTIVGIAVGAIFVAKLHRNGLGR
ncbi:MAG: phage holin family protein [Pseudomonadota bacterium]